MTYHLLAISTMQPSGVLFEPIGHASGFDCRPCGLDSIQSRVVRSQSIQSDFELSKFPRHPLGLARSGIDRGIALVARLATSRTIFSHRPMETLATTKIQVISFWVFRNQAIRRDPPVRIPFFCLLF